MANSLGFTTRAESRAGTTRVVGPQEALKTMGGIGVGAGLSALLIFKLFPTLPIVTAIGVGLGGSVLAASSPVNSLAEDLGIGATVFSVGYGALLATGQLRAPTPTVAGGARNVALRSGAVVTLRRAL